MGLPVTLAPDIETLGCEFRFGVAPAPLEEDDVANSPCFSTCIRHREEREEGGGMPCRGLSP